MNNSTRLNTLAHRIRRLIQVQEQVNGNLSHLAEDPYIAGCICVSQYLCGELNSILDEVLHAN